MKIGIQTRFGDKGATDIGYMTAFAQAVEAAGFDSLLMPEHVVFFPTYESKYPYAPDGKPPFTEEIGLFDPIFVTAALAQATTTLRFCTSVLVLTQRPALLTAKEVMTLDHIAKGRFDFGVGSGWAREEYEALGASFERRGKRFDEYIKVIKLVWSTSPASFQGEFVSFENVVMLPKPYTPGGPPFLIGGDSDAAMKRSVALADGWYGWWKGVELEPHLAKFRGFLEAGGRQDDPNFQLRIGTPHRDGPPDALVAKIEEARRLGVDEMCLALPVRAEQFEADIAMWGQAAGVTR